MARTLEQQRAAHAWDCARKGVGAFADYVNQAKSAPMLIMNSGLMQTLAFLEGKDKTAQALGKDICSWLVQSALKRRPVKDFQSLMSELHNCDSTSFRACTTEALAVLKWIRHFAPAIDQKGT